MPKLIEMPHNDGAILVEFDTADDGITSVSKIGEIIIKQIENKFDKVEDVIVNGGSILVNAVKKLAEQESKVDSATIEFGLNFTADGNAYIIGQGNCPDVQP